MTYTIAPAARALLAQATVRAPDRRKGKDGTVGDLAHRLRRSWHNPNVHRQTTQPVYDPDGMVLAVDLTHDPEGGCDAHALARAAVARNDPRVYEAISQGRIWTRLRAAEGWRDYDGTNPHDEHCHLSLTWAHHDDTSPWWPTAEELDMDEADVRRIVREEVRAALSSLYKTLVVGDPTHPVTLTRITKAVEEKR